jgi:hypothetical protein
LVSNQKTAAWRIINAEEVLYKEGILCEFGRSGHQGALLDQRGKAALIQIVGRGSFGVVYKAKMKYYPYSVRAIKRIRKQLVKSPADIIKEYSILTTLDHPQIIKIYETF